jgi:hypothetical protein
MTTGVAAIQLFGTRYRCRLRYLHIDSLDALSEFVLDVAEKSSQYKRIETLLQSFGLPPRIMEGVLADLVRTRRAWLDVERGLIMPISAGARGAEYEDRRVLDVWQDHLTGAILPANVVAPYSAKIEGKAALLSREAGLEEFIGFLDASDASLLSSLVRFDPMLEFSLDGMWRLDRFVNRVRLSSQALWVPITWAPIGEDRSPFVDAAEIPWWLARAWIAQLRQQHNIAVEMKADDAGADDSIVNAFQYARIRFHAGRWLDSAQEHLDLIPAPESLQDVRTLERRFGALQARLLSLVALSFPAPGEPARDSIVSAAPDLPPAREGAEQSGVERVLIHGSPDATEVKPPLRPVYIAGWRDEFSLIDGARLSLPVAGPAGARRVLEISGLDVGRAIEGLLRRLLSFEDAGALPFLEHASATKDALKDMRLAADDSVSVGRLLGELSEFRREFTLAMQDRRLKRLAENNGGPEGTVDGLVQAMVETPKISLAESYPSLADRLTALRRLLAHPMVLRHSAFAFMERHELIELIELIVAEPFGTSNLCQIVSRLSEDSLQVEVVRALERGVAAGWRFSICPPGNTEQIQYAQRMRALLPSIHIRFFAAPADWQACVVTLNDVVVAGTFHVLADRSGARLSQTWAIVLGEVDIGGELLDGSAAWEEIAQPQ